MRHCALITGATGGLGKAYTYELASRGYDLMLSATKQSRLEELAAEVRKKHENIRVFCKEADLSSQQSRENLVLFLKENEKNNNITVDTLVNNAGSILEMSFLGCTNEEILTAVRVNAEGTLDLTHKILSERNVEKKFFVLFVSSMASFYPMPQMATYAATKALITSFSVALREELICNNVNVSCVCPGSMATNQAMIDSIKSQGLGGKLSLVSVEKVAKKSINAMLKNKAICVPGFFNKFLHVISKITPRKTQAAFAGRRWRKCEAKRGEVK